MIISKGITIMMSLVWGFGLVILIKKVCLRDQCVLIKTPSTFNGTIIDGNKCYRLTKYPTQCSSKNL